MQEPFQHPKIIYTDELEPFLRLKLHILNLGRTYIADVWRRGGRFENEVVRNSLSDPNVWARLRSLYDDEVLPGFAAHGMGDQANRYCAETPERFDNPFLNHCVSDIFQNHQLKVERRVKDFITWVRAATTSLSLPRLGALAATPPT
jgi:tagaturonate reductase